MKWLLISFGVLVGLVLVAIVVGALLPKGHVARVSARYEGPPEAIWPTIADFSAWPSWNDGVRSMERLPDRDGKPVWLMRDSNGKLPSRVQELIAPEADRAGKLVTRIDDPSLPFGGTWTWNVVRDGDQTVVTITEDGEVHNPIFRLMSRLFFDPHATATRYLSALGKKHGQSVTPTPIIEAG